jgi:hypothetical protein
MFTIMWDQAVETICMALDASTTSMVHDVRT